MWDWCGGEAEGSPVEGLGVLEGVCRDEEVNMCETSDHAGRFVV
jgi:hypothetical protein